MSRRIGITGGIGGGKSAATDFLRSKGYLVVDADELAREAAAPGEPALLKLREKIGGGVFLPDGALNREALAKLIFSDPVTRKIVDEIFHSDIKVRMDRLLAHYEAASASPDTEARPVFLAVPLLFETGMETMVDETWLVTADDTLRLQRVSARDGLSSEEIQARMRSQLPENEKKFRADIVIENNGSLAALHECLEKLL